MKNYRADSCSVGDGWTDPLETARLWNKYIVPVLMANTDFTDPDPEPPMISIGKGMAAYANQWAWEEFCSREAGESEAAVLDLANELSAKFSTKKAAAAMGSVKSPAKSAASRTNGAKGGRPREVITYRASNGESIDICRYCEKDLAGNWPCNSRGEEFATVSHGLHPGSCQICNPITAPE